MATVNFRVDEALKEKSYSILKEQGIAPTDFFTSILEYVATTEASAEPHTYFLIRFRFPAVWQ